MKAVIQRVISAEVVINGGEKRRIDKGLLILLGVCAFDTEKICDKLAEKCAQLRIFEDENQKLNLSAEQLSYSALAVSNFTLCASTKKGRRPSFDNAAKQPLSQKLYNRFVQKLIENGIKNVQTGEFGADMQISLINDGPVTIIMDTDEWERE